jgi:stearoyl-CoA desaturase (delta-9 desaturase)
MRELTVLKQAVFQAERQRMAILIPKAVLQQAKGLLQRAPCRLTGAQREELNQVLAHSECLHQMHMAQKTFETLWERSSETQEQLLARLQQWCTDAEREGPRSLQRFARQLASYG